MICFAEEKNIPEIAALWNEAFGDFKEDVFAYLDNLLKYCVVYKNVEEVCGILFLIPLECAEKKGRYVYAAATSKRHRGHGIMTALLDFAKHFIETSGENFLLLVPENEDLFDFYGKRGFTPAVRIRKATVSGEKCEENAEITVLSAKEYFAERKKYFEAGVLIEWGTDILEFAQKMYCGTFMKVKYSSDKEALAFAVKCGEELILKELLSDNPYQTAGLIKRHFCAEKLSFVCPEKDGKYFAMIYPNVSGNFYFNIALD